MTTAVVVGSGPNGLSAAVVLAASGYDVQVLEAGPTPGGGARTAELTVPGVLHDVCSAVHPMGAASPFFRSLPLTDHGLEWRYPEVDVAHPLDGGGGAGVHRSIDDTAAGLGADGRAWRRFVGPPTRRIEHLTGDFFGPMVRVPDHPVSLATFGLQALAPASVSARRFTTREARALWGGVAAHVMYPLTRPTTTAVGLLMLAAGHSSGWPVAAGGSHAITDALVSALESYGGRVECGVTIRSATDIPPADVVMLNLTPSGVIDVYGDRVPGRIARAYRRWTYGPAAYKVDLAVEGGIPWTYEPARRAGTVHLGGSFEEMTVTERQVHDGTMPARPFVLVGQQYLADPSRSSGDVHPVWAYAHVPAGYAGDATRAVLDQFERFAPGTRDRIVGMAVRSPGQLADHNANCVGGDIAGGLNSPRQLLGRPRVSPDPYSTGIPGVYLCSGSTAPGGAVHGMAGWNAARAALRATGRRP